MLNKMLLPAVCLSMESNFNIATNSTLEETHFSCQRGGFEYFSTPEASARAILLAFSTSAAGDIIAE